MTNKEAADFFVEEFPQYIVSDLGPSRRQMAYNLAIKALEEKQKMQWTPVEEKLPDLDDDGYSEKVLVSFDKTSIVDIGEYRETAKDGKWYLQDMNESFSQYGLTVTAWMPLPKSYRRMK